MNEQTEQTEPVETKRNRAFRIEDELWNDAQRIANERGDNISELLRACLRKYVKTHK